MTLTTNGFKAWLDTFTAVAMAAAVMFMAWSLYSRNRPAKPTQPASLPKSIDLAGASIIGSAAAPVAIVEFSDFECPFCIRFATETMPSLMTKYVKPGKAFVAFRNFPLDSIHPMAAEMARAAVCADMSGQFAAVHDGLFEGPVRRSSDIRPIVIGSGVKESVFVDCMKPSGKADARVREDIRTGRLAGVSGTPTFFLGMMTAERQVAVEHRIIGGTLKDFDDAMSTLLARTKTASAR